jgi:predicted dehydrogenase
MTPIRIAVLGSGIFARDAHLPALSALPDLFEVAAIYSRTAEKAKALAATLPRPADTTTDLPALLRRDDIDAVDVILPILTEPEVILAALKAGKHVISEKPVAADVARGKALLQAAAKLTQANGRVWMVAENFRYIQEFNLAGQMVRRGDIGQPVQFCWTTYVNMSPQDKYYHTPWRRANNFPGGLLLDKGVHNMAAMRTIMGEVESVCAFAAQWRDDLPPVDTLSATLRFESGAFGVFTITVVAACPWGDQLHVVGDEGALRIDANRLEVTAAGGKTSTQSFTGNNVLAELTEYAHAIQQGVKPVATPAEALQDVAIIEAMLESARTGAAVRPERIG